MAPKYWGANIRVKQDLLPADSSKISINLICVENLGAKGQGTNQLLSTNGSKPVISRVVFRGFRWH